MELLTNSAKRIISILLANGYEAYAVGGCVRDALLGLEAKDTDITTSALPHQVKEVLSDYKIIETGLKHGTVTVIIDSEPIEVTTYRIDLQYENNRRPTGVVFSSNLKEDLARRDFTVNALACSLNGEIVDLFGGEEDLENKIIRAVGEPKERFCEDALRILRALRFASILGFTIEEKTARAIKESFFLLKNISAERIFSELKGIISGENFHSVLKEYSDVLSLCLGVELKGISEREIFKNPQSLYSRMAVIYLSLFSDKEECLKSFRKSMNSLKADNEIKMRVSARISCFFNLNVKSRYEIKKLMNIYGPEIVLTSSRIKKLMCKDFSGKEIEHTVLSIIENKECYSLKELSLTGKDLLEMGFKEGEKIGTTIDEIFQKVLKGELQNNREELMLYASKLSR